MEKIKKIIIAGLLTLVLVVQMTVPALATPSYEDIIQILEEIINTQQAEIDQLREQLQNRPQPTPTPPQSPMVRLVDPSNIDVMPGDVLDISITVRNIGMGVAHSLLTQASANGPIRVEFLGNTNSANTVSQNGQRQMNMRVTVDENAQPGNHTITLNHHFRNNAGVNTESQDVISVRIGGQAGASNVRLSNIHASVSTIGPEQNFTVTANLQNIGTIAANNVQVYVGGDISAGTLFVTSDLSQAFFPTLEAGQTTQVSFTFRTSRNIPTDVYQLDFRLNYEGAGERAPTPFFITALTEYAATLSPNIEMRGLSTPTGRLNVGQAGIISFELANSGDVEAHNIRITATSEDRTELVPTVHAHTQSIQSLAVGATREFQFGFMPTARAQTQGYVVQLSIQYSIRGEEGTFGFEQYVVVNVYNPEAQATPTPTPVPEPGGAQIPRLIVGAYSPYPQIVRAGQNFDMEISFLNTSPTRSVNNIRITLNSAEAVGANAQSGLGAVFTPVGGSNTLFIGYMGPGESVDKTITMFTIPDALPRVYTLDVVFDYQDDDYVEHTMSERLSIPVTQFARLETYPREIFVPESIDMSGILEFEFQVINTGRVALRNSWVQIEGPFDTRQGNIFMSTIGIGRTHFYRGIVTPLETGMLEGTILIFGEDDAGDVTEVRHEFSVYVMDGWGGFGDDGMFDGGFMGGDGMFEGGAFDRPGFEPWDEGGDGEGGFLALIRRPVFFGPVLGAVVLAVVVVIVIVSRKKSSLSFDDDFN